MRILWYFSGYIELPEWLLLLISEFIDCYHKKLIAWIIISKISPGFWWWHLGKEMELDLIDECAISTYAAFKWDKETNTGWLLKNKFLKRKIFVKQLHVKHD